MLCTDSILSRIREFADKSHGTQMRKYTHERYIVHPERVCEILRNYTDDITILAAAYLHDVVEDTPVSPEMIRGFLLGIMDKDKADRTVRLVHELTDQYTKEAYPGHNRKSRKSMEVDRMSRVSADAQTIKYADILDNCREIVSHDRHFAGIFIHECLKMMRVMRNGNQDLYRVAVEALEKGKQQLRS